MSSARSRLSNSSTWRSRLPVLVRTGFELCLRVVMATCFSTITAGSRGRTLTILPSRALLAGQLTSRHERLGIGLPESHRRARAGTSPPPTAVRSTRMRFCGPSETASGTSARSRAMRLARPSESTTARRRRRDRRSYVASPSFRTTCRRVRRGECEPSLLPWSKSSPTAAAVESAAAMESAAAAVESCAGLWSWPAAVRSLAPVEARVAVES